MSPSDSEIEELVRLLESSKWYWEPIPIIARAILSAGYVKSHARTDMAPKCRVCAGTAEVTTVLADVRFGPTPCPECAGGGTPTREEVRAFITAISAIRRSLLRSRLPARKETG